ncbi:MAG: AbgT family transporter [Synergistaceae bacterium]|nr:AbgT family transporter [Synergistaceae bacterium]
MSQAAETKKRGLLMRFIRGVEIVGNKLPHPFWLFVILSGIILALSWWLGRAGMSVQYVAAAGGGGESKEVTVSVINLLNYKSMRVVFTDLLKIYAGFPPLGLIIVMTLGIGLLEQSGMISALMRKTILGAPSYLVTFALAIIGINANLASDAGIIFTPMIGAAIFKALGRNPWIGITAGYAASQGGFTANFFIAGTDALLAGITESAAKGMNIPGPIHPLMNWYLMVVATVVVAFVTTFVTEKITCKYLGDEGGMMDAAEIEKHKVTDDENRGLKWSMYACIAYILVIFALTFPEGSFFRGDDGNILPRSPFLSSVAGILFGLFFFMGIAYGYGAKIIKEGSDIPKMMEKGLKGGISFLVVVLPAAIFIHLFNASNLATVLAVNGADWLKEMKFTGAKLIVAFVCLTTVINLFISSGSAKWLILAPIFVPMLGMMGFSPALTQAAYRVGDSVTNNLAPLSYYVPVMIGFYEQYKSDPDQEVGIGTLISLQLPYSILYLILFTALLVFWFTMGWPLGPGADLFITM